MNGRSNLNELLDVLEEIRKNKYPNVPAEVIRRIVVTQYDNQDKRLEARNTTNKIVTEYLNSAITTTEG